jgi:hypothetical protein
VSKFGKIKRDPALFLLPNFEGEKKFPKDRHLSFWLRETETGTGVLGNEEL